MRERTSGVLLIAGALAGLVVMAFHPSGHDAMDHARGAWMNKMVHGLALWAIPLTFLGLFGIARRLGSTHETIAALVAFGFGSAAVMSAALASGFVTPGVRESIVAAEGSRVPEAFMVYTFLWNQAYAKVYAVACSVGVLLWSVAILRTARLSRAAGIAGIAIGTLLLIGILSGHLGMNAHGFGLIVLGHSAWLIWVGALLCRGQSPQ